MLRHRLFFGAILIAALLGLIYADGRLSAAAAADSLPLAFNRLGLQTCDGLIITLVLAFLAVVGTFELHRLFTAAGHAPLLGWPIAVNLGLLLLAFHAGNNPADDRLIERAEDYHYTVVWLTLALLGTALLVARRRQTDRAVGNIAVTLLMIFYLGVLPQYLVRLRLLHPTAGVWLLLYAIGIVKLCDIGAYFTGRYLGKHKLIEWLSPKKTVEGLLGGIAASVLLALLVPLLVRWFAAPESPLPGLFPRPGWSVVFGLSLALIGQAGDLLESLFKRDAQAKDSAHAVPAFGGVLDIIDSPLLAAPLAYWLLLQ